MKARRTSAAKTSAVPKSAVPLEAYDSRRKAEFLLNNAIDAADYAQAIKEVRKLGPMAKQKFISNPPDEHSHDPLDSSLHSE